jgi:hypothetical protein
MGLIVAKRQNYSKHIYVFYRIILLLNTVASKQKAPITVAFLICTLTVLFPLSSQVFASSAYDSGYGHGCDDAKISDSSERYTNQPEKGPSYHTDEFNNGYDAGFSNCSSSGTSSNGGNDDGEESSSSSGSESGYQFTVNVPSHPFGKPSVDISITTENGHRDSKTVSTAGNPSWTFDIPPNQGDSVEVCVDSGLLTAWDCKKYSVSGGGDRTVSLSAP